VRFALVFILLIASSSSCSTKDDKHTGTSSSSSKPTNGDGLPCRDDASKSAANGKVTSCLLTKDFTIDGFECVGGKMIEMQPQSNKLKGCYLKSPKSVDGWSCQDGLSLYPSGKLRRCKVTAGRNAGEGIDVRAGDWVTIYEGTGAIKRLELASGANRVQGYPCKGYLNFFHENGKLKKCELSDDVTIEGKKVSAKTDAGLAGVFVCFDDAGKRVDDCTTLSGMTLD